MEKNSFKVYNDVSTNLIKFLKKNVCDNTSHINRDPDQNAPICVMDNAVDVKTGQSITHLE